MVAGRRRSTPANGCSPRVPEGRDGTARPGRSSRWSTGRWGWRESPMVSYAVEEALGAKWFWGGGGSQSKLSRGKGSREGEGVPGGESGEGEALVAPHWSGNGGGRTSRTRGRRPSLSRLLAKAVLEGSYEVALGLE